MNAVGAGVREGKGREGKEGKGGYRKMCLDSDYKEIKDKIEM